jgi:hypothetical protein
LISFSFSSLCFFLDSKVLNILTFVINLIDMINEYSYSTVT